jgi:hypothetical protein
VARHSPSFNHEDASSGAQAEFPVMPTGYRSSPSSLDSLGCRVDQRGLIYVLTVSDLVSSRPRLEVIRESFPDEGGGRQSADSLAAMRAALEQTYEAILCTNSWQATKAPTRSSRRPLKANTTSTSVEPLNPIGVANNTWGIAGHRSRRVCFTGRLEYAAEPCPRHDLHDLSGAKLEVGRLKHRSKNIVLLCGHRQGQWLRAGLSYGA